MRTALALSVLVAWLPPAMAAGPHLEATVQQDDALVEAGSSLPFAVSFTLTCGQPPLATTVVELHPLSGNYFNVSLERLRWEYSAPDCASQPLRGSTNGTFRFLRDLPPLHELQFPVDAWAGDGTHVMAVGHATLRATPDVHLNVGAVLDQPGPATRDGPRLVESANWKVANHGLGAFHADVTVESKPDWLDVQVPGAVDSSGPDDAARATFRMTATLASPCPAPIALVTLALHARGLDPQSRATEEVRVQGKVPCAEPPAGASAAPLALVLGLLAFAAQRRRGRARMHKR